MLAVESSGCWRARGKAETTNEAASFGVTFVVALLVKLLAAPFI